MAKRKRTTKASSDKSSASSSRALAVADQLEVGASLPDRLPLLPLRTDVVFPLTVVPLIINRPAGIKLVDDALLGDRTIAVVTQRQADIDDPAPGDLYPIACIVSILKMLKFPDGSTRIVVQGLARAKLVAVETAEPYLVGQLEPLQE